jgi:hypothetical protein
VDLVDLVDFVIFVDFLWTFSGPSGPSGLSELNGLLGTPRDTATAGHRGPPREIPSDYSAYSAGHGGTPWDTGALQRI